MRNGVHPLKALLLVIPCLLSLLSGCKKFQERSHAWTKCDHAAIALSGAEGSAHWDFRLNSEAGEAAIAVEERSEGRQVKGEILLIDGKAVAVKGLEIEPGSEINALDGRVLMLQVVQRILSRAFPGGLTSLKKENRIRVDERIEGISVGTVSAAGDYPAPWKATGTARRTGKKAMEYDMEFSFGIDGRGKPMETMHISGLWERKDKAFHMPDATSLRGWRIFGMGARQRADGTGAMIDYGMTEAGACSTVGELRAVFERTKKDVPR